MSAWQFKTRILPVSGLLAHHGTVPKHVEVIRYSDSIAIEELERLSGKLPNYWVGFTQAPALALALAELLPERESWSSLARLFGSKSNDEIEIWKNEDGSVCRICVSFCLNDPDARFIQAALKLVDTFECVFLAIQSCAIFSSSIDSFLQHAERSTASRFIPDDKPLRTLLRKQ